jgi:hypothetical protein
LVQIPQSVKVELFKKKKENKSNIQFVDLDGNELQEGDQVISQRYDLGKCVIGKDENGYYYESLESKKKVSWTLMIDAATERQKVNKVQENI